VIQLLGLRAHRLRGTHVAGHHALLQRLPAFPVRARLGAEIESQGYAVCNTLDGGACRDLARIWDDELRFRKRIIMQQHAYGRGEYRYFAYPLPEIVASLRSEMYPPLSEIANRWNRAMGLSPRYPDDHAEFLARCHAAGQTKPTPLAGGRLKRSLQHCDPK